jgi:hypothetical protein
MSWGYRIVRRKDATCASGYKYGVYRVFFENEEPVFCEGDPVAPTAEDVVGLLDELASMLESCLNHEDVYDHEYISKGGTPRH